MDQLKCIVFDVDDTLYLERDYVRSGFSAVGAWLEEKHNIEGFGERAWELFETGLRGVVFNRVLEERGTEPTRELIGALVQVYRTHCPMIELLPDARECLELLGEQYQLAALTGGPVESQRAKVHVLEVGRWCDPIIYAGQWGKEFDKPHPRPFKELEKQTGRVGAECLYVSDNPKKDFDAPLELGWEVARVRRPGGIYEQHPGQDGVVEFREFGDLRRWLKAIE